MAHVVSQIISMKLAELSFDFIMGKLSHLALAFDISRFPYMESPQEQT
jgi:hypothetical protein